MRKHYWNRAGESSCSVFLCRAWVTTTETLQIHFFPLFYAQAEILKWHRRQGIFKDTYIINHRTICVGRNCKDHLVAVVLPQANIYIYFLPVELFYLDH